MLINLWVRDKRSGTVHQVGTDIHDSVVGLHNGFPTYYNLQNGDGTAPPGEDSDDYGYEWVVPEDMDDYIPVTQEQLYLNRELIHEDIMEAISKKTEGK